MNRIFKIHFPYKNKKDLLLSGVPTFAIVNKELTSIILLLIFQHIYKFNTLS
jgi:hypothetical protein